MRHRRRRIQLRSACELAGSFVMIETENQRNSLIEELLSAL
jgi:hypothetical protein